MEIKEIEVFSDATNTSIVRMPNRGFPGVVIHGDSLSIFFDQTMTLVEKLANFEDEEVFLTALEMAERIEAHLLHYEETLQADGITLPYVRDLKRSPSKYAHRWNNND